MAEQHTNTPWYCEGDAIYDNPECTGNPIAHVLSCAYGADDNAVDARRIVACVNACDGLPTETLEAVPGYKAAIEGFHEQRDARLAAEAQRDQLLGALTSARRELQACQAVIHLAGGFDPAYVTGAKAALAQADAAIAAVKGEYIQQAGRATRKVGVTFITPPGMSADELKASILRMEGDAQ